MANSSKKVTYTTPIIEKKQLTHNVFSIRLEKPSDFTYKAGQFVQWTVPDGDKSVLRSYSLCTTPTDNYLEFCIKILPDGKASKMVLDKKVGDEVTFSEIRGRFIVENTSDPVFFIATGVGIAPIMGIVKDLLVNKKTKQEINLLFGVHAENDIFWHQELSDLAEKHANFNYELTLSQPSDKWEGKNGRVTAHLENHPAKHQYFICGSPEMIKDCRSILLPDVDPKSIHFEIF